MPSFASVFLRLARLIPHRSDELAQRWDLLRRRISPPRYPIAGIVYRKSPKTLMRVVKARKDGISRPVPIQLHHGE